MSSKVKIVKEDGYWNVVLDNEIIGTIELEWRFNKADAKVLYIGNQAISKVKNQKEAIEKVNEYLSEIKTK